MMGDKITRATPTSELRYLEELLGSFSVRTLQQKFRIETIKHNEVVSTVFEWRDVPTEIGSENAQAD